jgi:hypothetical protein
MSDALKILVFSTLYPNSQRPAHGIFVETRLKQWYGLHFTKRHQCAKLELS